MLAWLRARRRRRLLASPFPPGWLTYLERNVGHYALLTDAERARLRDDLRVFIAEKMWEGCGGLTMTEEIQVTVAAQACLLLLGIEHDYFRRVLSILVYPGAYRSPRHELRDDGLVHEDPGRLGEAWYRGPVVLAWDEVRRDGLHFRDGRNVVLHEFAHQLDFLDGWADGTPPLQGRAQYRKWQAVMTAEYGRLVEASEQGRATLLDQYGSQSPTEFFAVATECFFEKPVALARRHPALYEVLRDYYGQDTAARFTRGSASDRPPSEPHAPDGS